MGKHDTVGTPLGASWGGIDFRVKADASIDEQMRKYATELIPSTGDGMQKKERKIQALNGFTFMMNQNERKEFDDLADTAPHKFDYTDPAGFTITGQAIMSGDSSRTSDEGVYTCDVQFVSKPTMLNP